MATMEIGVIIGSLRKEAWSRKVANQLIKLAPDSMTLQIISVAAMPLYNEDDETATPPAAWTEFRKQVLATNGILFVTPEYNRSIPAPLKNAIDVGSRPYGKSIWNKKPCAIASSSPGAIGGFGANHHLRQSLVCLSAPCMPAEMYLSAVHQLFDEKGELTNPNTEKFMRQFMQSFAEWVQHNS